ncbi:MAG: arginyl-tRNA synthetase [Candidatus Atribacteria bacterium]|nr:arginyl-tRNA synthetase [Candidatus Atribacteria bacterium]
MSQLITELFKGKIEEVLKAHYPSLFKKIDINLEPTRDKQHGDYATNLAFLLSREFKKSPREIAKELLPYLNQALQGIAQGKVAGGGFINFVLEDSVLLSSLKEILKEKERFGESDTGKGEKIQVEFVSVNPTGPLHVGHGKCAAFGDALARVLKKAGFTVEKEYYINNAGRQTDLLGLSLEVRTRQILGEEVEIPEDGYRGEYLVEIAREVLKERGKDILSLPDEERTQLFKELAIEKIMGQIKGDLENFRVQFDVWFSEKSLFESGEVDQILTLLKERGYTFEKEGALWLKTTLWGDDKDRVLIRENGSPTYFTSDIAYHWNKWKRGFFRVIDVWGADHHGYIPRMKAAIQALGIPEDFLEIFIVQFVTLLRAGQPERMSTRQGEFIPLRQLVDEVGVDVARYYFLMRDPATHLEFDIEVAKKQSMDNPVYYIQYAHARICSVFQERQRQGFTEYLGEEKIAGFYNQEEREIAKKLIYFPEIVKRSAISRQPYLICNFLYNLAGDFHAFYNLHRIIDKDKPIESYFRLVLCRVTQIVLKNGLDLLGITAPDSM